MARSYKELRGGRELVYIVCPLCGRNRVLESERARQKGKGELRWDFFDPKTGLLVQVREAGGKLPHEEQPEAAIHKRGGARAYGFPLKHGLTMEEAKAQGYDELLQDIKLQVNRLYKFFNQT